MGRTIYYKRGIQLPQLRTFCMVATEESFTAAAKLLGLSVPAVWQQIRAMERELETILVRRRGRRIELTPEGRLLLSLVQPHVSGLDSLANVFEARKAELHKWITVASTHYLLSYHLPETLNAYSQAHPLVGLRLRACPVMEVPSLVEKAEADVGVLTYDRYNPRNSRLEYEDLFEMRLMLLTATDHPLARMRQVRAQDLVRYPMILTPQGTPERSIFERLSHRYQFNEQLRVVMEAPTFDLISKYILSGTGIALIYMRTPTEPGMPPLQVRVFDPKLDALSVALVFRKGVHHSETVFNFRDLVHRSGLIHIAKSGS
jgi:DNA-binding transcriptional LysR family regulator